MGFEDEAEQSNGRPCRQTNGRSKRPCELTSSIVPRGTSFYRRVELEFPRDIVVTDSPEGLESMEINESEGPDFMQDHHIHE